MALLPLNPSPTLSKTIGYRSTNQRNNFGIPWWTFNLLLSSCVFSTDVIILKGVVVKGNLLLLWTLKSRLISPLLGEKHMPGDSDENMRTYPIISVDVMRIVVWIRLLGGWLYSVVNQEVVAAQRNCCINASEQSPSTACLLQYRIFEHDNTNGPSRKMKRHTFRLSY